MREKSVSLRAADKFEINHKWVFILFKLIFISFFGFKFFKKYYLFFNNINFSVFDMMCIY
ncbi:hypothetical protein VIM7927_03309 [Vibrio mangrovi]|uniref:Uncharacterized protein n=1 Tax=Vibrio mangrovi TaxID=474394 RepID=A0A1Y6IWJ6_9VIBR|nr:hypothetical protein VIM7927_03309 [Vibrio mangrovi]